MIRVLLADDSEVMRQAIARLLHDDDDIELIAQTGSVNDTIQLARQLRPDVIVMDLHMATGRDTPMQVSSCLDGSCLLAISFAVDELADELAASFGAVALLDKMKLAGELLPAIKKHRPNTKSRSSTA